MSSTTPSATPTLRLVPPSPTVEPAPQPAPAQERRVQLILAALKQDVAQPHTLASLAALVELCPRQLERLFKDEMGQSPMQYLHDLRLATACKLLVTEFKNVTEIAAAVGFDDVNYFIRVFRAQYGCTPLAYRKRSAGELLIKKIA